MNKQDFDNILAYNMADVHMLVRMDEMEQEMWIADLKRRWGIFWRIPYWWHHGRHPVIRGTKK